ncbi:MAG: 3-isopropylmalate dehydratase large subunit [Bdellovibrionota bacterium]|jgi:3-isopropylmalate/(R)-2-methylmalate dehydratase large subunit
MKSRNIIEKLWDAHVVTQQEGHPVVLAIDFLLMHEVTSPQAFEILREKKLKPFDTRRILGTLDHSVPTRQNREEIYDETARKQVETMRQNCHDFGIFLCDYGNNQGVIHVVAPEFGVTQPGMTIVCGDSHTSTHGAFGALSFGIGTSEVANVLATGCLLQQPPKTMKVEFKGSFKEGVYAKDAILQLIAQIGAAGGTGYVIEYCGEAIRKLRMDERMTICNMSIECGARAGLIAPDATTYEYLKGLPFAPQAQDFERAVEYWETFKSDNGCSYNSEVIVDVDNLTPMITWGTSPGQAIPISGNIPTVEELPQSERLAAEQALEYIGLQHGQSLAGVAIDWAFVGSCTNGRIEDLRIAAQIVKGKKVHPNVTFYVVPGSEKVRDQAIAEGLDQIFREAGADFRMPGCSLCLGMNDDRVPAGKRSISSSNRNFRGRQGAGSRTHLASPATVAKSALAGCITA